MQYDVIVYGGGFAGVAAAAGAARLYPGARVLLIAPESRTKLGGLFTAGGQNYWDVRFWRGTPPQAGSFARWYGDLGQFYGAGEMAGRLQAELADLAVETLLGWDIEDPRCTSPPPRLTGLSLRQLVNHPAGGSLWGPATLAVGAPVFVDASDDGRLARLAGALLSTGRADWPAACLPPDERWPFGRPRQQAATLMFQVRGVEPGPYADMTFVASTDARGRTTLAAWGGHGTYTGSLAVTAYNDACGPLGHALKPINAAQNGPDAEEWWVNGLLLFNVDGRARERDWGTWRFPADMRPDARTCDAAWRLGRAIVGSRAFLQALRCFQGFEAVEIVRESSGLPVVGEIVYLRESVHAMRAPRPGESGLENSNYAVTADALLRAGAGYTGLAADDAAYSSRVGLGFYNADINAYCFSDMRTDQGFIWPVTSRVRPDRPGNPENPVYLPYAALLTPTVRNLLLAGYACGSAAMAFTALRVGPNLCVLGDAAGAAAARAVQSGLDPADFGPGEVAALQDDLRRLGVRLEK